MAKRAAPQSRGKTGGRFEPGKSGNPGGRPKGVRAYVSGLIGEDGHKAYDIAWEIAQGKRESRKWVGGGGDSGPIEVVQLPSVKEQLEASTFLIERLQGKAPQPEEADVDLSSATDEQLQTKLTEILRTLSGGAA